MKRLAFRHGTYQSCHLTIEYFRELYEISPKTSNWVWHPIISFKNWLNHETIDVYGGNKPFSFFFSQNMMFYGEEFKLTFSCPFEFSNFPFDSHICPMEYGDKVLFTYYLSTFSDISDPLS